MKLKNTIKSIFMAGIITLAAFDTASAASNACSLIIQLKSVFVTLRTLAFIGAAFIIASCAWDFIKGGGEKDDVMDTLKKKGI